MDDFPMITRILMGVFLLAALFAVVLFRDSHRERALRAWAAKRREARLHWPFDVNDGHAIPCRELAEIVLGRAPLGWGAALEIERPADQIWFLECRSKPPGHERADWFTLVARGPNGETHDPAAWQCQLLDEVLSAEALNRVLSRGASVTPDPAQDDQGVTGEKQ